MSEPPSRPFQLSANTPLKIDFEDSLIASKSELSVLRKHGNYIEFLWRLSTLARQQISWSPIKIFGELWRLLTNRGLRREISKLLKQRPFNEIVEKNPRFAFKYLAPYYLTRSFTLTERVACFLHHYKRLRVTLSENALRQILHGAVKPYEVSNGINCFALTMGPPEPIGDREGELSLDLRVDGRNVFNLSFTIVPGWVVKSEADEILLITRLQGTSGCRAQIRLARKAFHEFFPSQLLLAALQGVAEALGIRELKAVCAANQKSYRKEYDAILRSGYDDFFANRGMTTSNHGFYSSPIPIEGRPLTSFKGRNRSRARKRRATRQEIQWAFAAFLSGSADRLVHSRFCEVNPTHIPAAIES